MGYIERTNTATPNWTRKAYNNFCSGEVIYGRITAKGIKAVMLKIEGILDK